MSMQFGNITSAYVIYDMTDVKDTISSDYSINGKPLSGEVTLFGTDIKANNDDLTTVTEMMQTIETDLTAKQDLLTEQQLSAIDEIDNERTALLNKVYPVGSTYFHVSETAVCPIEIAGASWTGPTETADGTWMWTRNS